jgi:hypothetical protein
VEREFKAALTALIGMAVTLLFAFLSFRVIVPSIIDAHFTGSTFVAAVVGIMLAVSVVSITVFWVRLIGRLLRGVEQAEDKETK